MKQTDLSHLIDYYLEQGAPAEQQSLIMLLKEVQQICGGALPSHVLPEIAEAYRIKSVILQALVRRIPSLYTEQAPHRLEICGTCSKSASVVKFVEEAYGVKSGEISKTGGFFFCVTGCMKNCRQGPSVRWDGQLISRVSTDTLRHLIEASALPNHR